MSVNNALAPANVGTDPESATHAAERQTSAFPSAVSSRARPSRISSRLIISDGAMRTTSGPASSATRTGCSSAWRVVPATRPTIFRSQPAGSSKSELR